MHDRPEPLATRYAEELALLQELQGWTLADLYAAPFDFVEEVLIRRRYRIKWEREKEKFKK